MSKRHYKVKMTITYHKDVSIYAECEGDAEEKAIDLVSNWSSVQDCDVLFTEEQ